MQEVQLSHDVDDFLENQRYFNNVGRFTQIKPLSHGAEGYSFLVHEVDECLQRVRKLVIKYARREGWEETTQKEKDLLEQMRHAPHIVNPVDIDTTHLERVLLVMEYLENGTLHQLMQRVKSRECRIPNLVLWRIFLCLTRAVVAMAYPPPAPVQRETITTSIEPISLVHNDLHMGNILIGALDLGDNEHDIVPIVKLIDFGFATELGAYGRDHPGVDKNILDIGNVMGRVVRTFSGNWWNVLSFLDDEELDNELKMLIRASIHPNITQRPQLQQLLTDCEAAVANRSAAYYSENGDRGFSEIRESLRYWIKDILLDADDSRELCTASDEIIWAPLDISQPLRSYASDMHDIM